MTDKMRECPFCGRPVRYVTSRNGYRVVCDDCDIQGPRSSNSHAEARELWNQGAINRAPDPLVAELVAELRNIYICLANDDIYRWETVLENIEKALARYSEMKGAGK